MVSLGIAKGSIQIGLEALQRSRQVVASISQQIGTSVERAFKGSASAVQSFNKQLESTNARLKTVHGELLAISVAGTALNVVGLKTADTARLIEARYRAITGSQEEALALMEQIADAARRTGLPVRQTQQDFAGLIPILRETGGDLEQYLSLVTRLSTLNPQEGTSGAIFAIREALSSGGTDLVSLSERFNIPRKTLRELIAETGNFGDALDIALDKLGATAELAEETSKGLSGASARFRDAGQRALERGFTPFVEGAAKALDGLAVAIENTPDGLLQIGAGAAIAVTGFASMTLAISQLITSYQNLQKAGFFTSFASVGKNIGKAGVLAGAAAVGTGIGIAGVNAVGRATGNERLANFNLQQAGEILKQALFLIVHALIEGGRLIALAFGRISSALTTIPETIQIWRAQLEIAFADILIGIENIRKGFTGDQGERGLRRNGEVVVAPMSEGERLREQGLNRLQDATTTQQAIMQRGDFNINTAFDEFQLAAARAFGFIESEAEATTEAVEAEISAQEALRQAQLAAQQAANDEFLASLPERISFEQEYAKLLREGTPEQINDRIQALADEKAAIEQFLPELEDVAKTSEEGAEQLAEYRARLEEIDTQSARFGEAMIQASKKAIAALDSDFATKVAAIEAEREKAVNESLADLQKGLNELDADVLEKSNDLRAANIEALEAYQATEREIVAEHRDKILEIERKGREDVIDAASRLDAAGVFAARKRREEQLSEENKRFADERHQNAAKLAETQKGLAEETIALQAHYVQRRNELITENQADIAQLHAKFNAEIATANAAYQTERQQLAQHLNAQLAARQAAQQRENSILSQGLQAAQNLFGRFVNGITSQLSGMQGASKSIGSQITNFRPAGNVITSAGGGGTGSMGTARNNTFSFATGGVASFAGRGSAWAMVENKERILTPQQNANFERLINAISGTGGARDGQTGVPNNLSVDVTGVDSFEALVARVTRQVLGQIYEARLT